MMIIIGVSGGVASGKNFVSECFLKFGAKIFDADAEVAKLFSDNPEFQKVIKEKFPDSILNNKINKDLIAKKIFSDEFSLDLLESIIHPIINQKIDQFIADCKFNNISIVLLNIPLLFEKDSYKRCDIAILIVSSINLRKDRFIVREKEKNSKISDFELLQKFNKITLNQKSDKEKGILADAIIYNDSDRDHIISQIKLILQNS
ncbi:MAG: dephospho-CoA kinase [Rickettsiales bacterium]|jgi:dephospho-CoA kinase